MTSRTIRTLLIEDDLVDAEVVARILQAPAELPGIAFDLIHEEQLSAGLNCLRVGRVDIVLLDLNLPDAHGLDSLVKIKQVTDLPVVVLTGLKDTDHAFAAIRGGAQDFLVKGRFDQPLLTRSLTYAVERKLLRDQLEQVRQREQQERELSRWDGYSHADPAAVTASLFGIRPLWDQSPQVFEELLAEYSTLLDLAVERRMFQTEQDHAEKTRALADSLGRAKAGPRDVVELHSRAIRKKSKVPQHKKAQVYIEEGRLKIVELMGYLVSYYRNYALGRRFGESSGPSVSNPKSENATEDSP